MTTSPKTLAQTIASTLGHNLMATLALAAVIAFGLATQTNESVTRPAVTDSARGIIETYACTNPDNPTHAVVTIDGTTRYVGQRLADKAIEQAVFGIDHGMTVHAFC